MRDASYRTQNDVTYSSMMISKFTLVGMAANKTKSFLGKKYIADFGVIVIIGNGDKLDIKFI